MTTRPETPRGRYFPFRDRAVERFVRPLDTMTPLMLPRRRRWLLIVGTITLVAAAIATFR